MSVRAHRVEEIKTNGSSFNLWHDKKVVDWLFRHTSFFKGLNGDICGLTSVDVCELQKMLSEIGEQIDLDVRESIREDIDEALAKGDQYVTYYCY